MSIAPHTGIVDFGTFAAPTASTDGVQGEVPMPLAGQAGYVLTATGWASAGSVGLVGYQGTWNASANSPTLTSSVGTQGYYYVVSIAGSTNLNGITDWQVGDWAIFNGSVWQKVDNTDSYDPTNVAITGGTINNTTIGGTTPAAGTFTTLTAQTEVLRTTGNNLFPRSQTFSPYWASGGINVTVTDNAVTAPDSTTTAAIILPTVTNGLHRVLNASPTLTIYSGVTYTASFYAKANGYRYLFANSTSTIGVSSVFDLQAGTVSTTTGTATITSVGSSWYRCTVTGTALATGSPSFYLQINSTYATGDQSFAGDGTSSIYLWGAQLEIGSSATTYVVTGATGIWNVPSLSFASSSASQIGLQSDGSLYVQPAGTGAIQAQATTSSATGGNARGAYAVDWQTSRTNANNVASAQNSFIGGGISNRDNGAYGALVGGNSNTVNASYGAVVGGNANSASGGDYATVVSGNSNTAAGYYNFIGSGFTNSGTSGSAVTTQSATMNSTTAVTLSGSNGSIKVGQYITGTSIAGQTYVAAISGTSLTLSQAASGSSTSTLSFFTPHGVVVGGGNNQATGAYSFIGGGGDAGTAANRNTASGAWSTIAGGWKNVASGEAAFVGGGGSFGGGASGNTASATSSFVGAGIANTASGYASTTVGGSSNTTANNYSFVGGGNNNNASAVASAIVGGSYGTVRGITGMQAMPACSSPISGTLGITQASLLVLARETTNATATVLCSDGNAASGINQITLPNNSAFYFKGSVIANVTGAANGAAWSFEGAIMRGANAGSTVFIGTPALNRVATTSGASAWVVALTVDTTNGSLAVTVTGAAATTIRWVAKVETTEVTF